MNRFSSILTIFLISATTLLFWGCASDDDLFRVDFSASPPPVSLAGITPDTLGNGILIYTIREGELQLGPVNERDVVWMRFTIWRGNGLGNIRDSSFRFGNRDSIRVELEVSNILIATGPYFPKLVAGLNENAFIAAQVPPSVTGAPDTLRYDINLAGVFERVEFRKD